MIKCCKRFFGKKGFKPLFEGKIDKNTLNNLFTPKETPFKSSYARKFEDFTEELEEKQENKPKIEENEPIESEKQIDQLDLSQFETGDSPFLIDEDIVDLTEENSNTIQIEEQPEEFPSQRLVHRPSKTHVWGLGDEALRSKRFFKSKKNNLDEYLRFLEAYKIEEITVVPTKELGYNHLTELSIVGVGFTNKHVYSTMASLSKQLKAVDKEFEGFSGRKDEEWFYLTKEDITVHLVSKKFKRDMNLEEIWTHKPTEEEIEEDFYYKMSTLKEKK